MWTLAMMGHGRWDYLRQAVDSIDDSIGWDFFDRTVLSVDGIHPTDWPDDIAIRFGHGCWTPSRQGLTANLGQLWKAIEYYAPSMVLHVEEDFTVAPDVPLDDMAETLDTHPNTVNMCLLRQPWSPVEQAAGSVLNVKPQAYIPHSRWVEHSLGFWLNPCVYHSSVTEVGAGTEAEITARLPGRTFGYWGTLTDEPRCIHIGTDGGMGSAGWKS